MRAYAISVGAYKMKVQTGRTVRIREGDTRVKIDALTAYKIMAAVEEAVMALLVNLYGRYDYWRTEREKMELAQYPPHTIFCECAPCMKPFMKDHLKKGKR